MQFRPDSALVIPCLVIVVGSAGAQEPGGLQWDEQANGPLPRYREGGTPPVDPGQSLQPYALEIPLALRAPTSGYIESPPEYSPSAGVVFRYSTGAWPEVVTDCVVALTDDPTYDEIAWVIVSSTSQQTSATNQFTSAGADMNKVQFIIMPSNSIWLRDYGPHFIWQSGALGVADSHYYPSRPLDNFIPTLLADDAFHVPSYDMGLYYSGGNFQPAADRWGFVTTLINQDNDEMSDEFIAELYQTYQGIDTLHIFPRLPSSVDGTGHIDMWLYLVDADTVIISEFLPGEDPTAIAITNNAAAYMEFLGYEVVRVPDHNGYHPYDSNCHYTYTNAYRVNDRIFIPAYGGTHAARDAEAEAAWKIAAPEARIVPIDCYDIIWAAGAIHCIVMQVPRYTDPVPAAHIVSPGGGELLVSGTIHDLAWAASDDLDVTAIDLFYSTDGGSTFPHAIATGEPNDGHFDWLVPDTFSPDTVVRAVAHDADANSSEAVSTSAFIVSPLPQTVYDFSTGAGLDRWAWGHQTSSWTFVEGVRYPVSSVLSPTAYAALAASDATGSDSDTNRYRSPYPSSGYESTHVFEFTINEDPSTILDIGVFWEGYGDDCTQAELYVWDDVQADWCNAAGLFGENRFVDNWAGNRDENVQGHIRSDFDRLVDSNGLFTMLLYAERPSDRTFHDYVALTVTYTYPGDLDGSGAVDIADLLALLAAWGPCPPPCAADLDGDGSVGILDLLALLEGWG
ncbi:MAG: agmatine deiminase family protein [Planctomycetota bacterium]|jgi:agmatine/peptidylarginine deiminase